MAMSLGREALHCISANGPSVSTRTGSLGAFAMSVFTLALESIAAFMEMAVFYDATDFLSGAREQKKNRAADFVAAKTIEHCALCSSAAQRNKPRTVIDAAGVFPRTQAGNCRALEQDR